MQLDDSHLITEPDGLDASPATSTWRRTTTICRAAARSTPY